MPRTVITPQRLTAAGITPTYEAANVLGNSYKLAAGRIMHVKNGAGAPITVTIPTTQAVDGLTVPARTVTVPATSDKFVALGTAATHRQTGGLVNVDYSSVTTVTVAVLDAA
jgi:hypothetical protein